jgi:hypothetical protein
VVDAARLRSLTLLGLYTRLSLAVTVTGSDHRVDEAVFRSFTRSVQFV